MTAAEAFGWKFYINSTIFLNVWGVGLNRKFDFILHLI